MQAYFRQLSLTAAVTALLALSAQAAVAADTIPPASDRPLGLDEGPRIATAALKVRGVGEHPEIGITAKSVQSLADGLLAQTISGTAPSWEKVLGQSAKRDTKVVPVSGLTIGELQRIAEQLALHLRHAGLVLAQAYVPVQTVEVDGVVLIDVLEGKLGKVVVEGSSRLSPELVAASASSLENAPLTKDGIENALLTAQTFPGSTVSGTFRPGKNTGETDLVLRVTDEDRFAFNVGADNYGTTYAGEYRVRAEALVNNLSGYGDQLSLSAIQAFHPSDTTLGSARYTFTPGSPNLHVHLAAERTEFVVENANFALFNLDGSNTTFEGGVSIDMARSRTLTVTSSVAYQVRQSEVKFDNLAGQKLTDDDLRVTVLGLNAQHFDAKYQGVDFANATIRIGSDRGDKTELFRNDEHYTAASLSYSRYQRITDTQSLLINLRGQLSEDSLSALERFSLGGPDSVRAYPVSEVLKDRGWLGTLEYRIAAPGFSQARGPFGQTWGKILQVVAFADYAWGELSNLPNSDQELSGAGGGLLVNLPKRFTFRLSVATPLGALEPSDGDDVRAYSEVAVQF